MTTRKVPCFGGADCPLVDDLDHDNKMSHPPQWAGHNTAKSIADVSSSAAAAQLEFERQAVLARANILAHEHEARAAATGFPSFVNQPSCEFGSNCIQQNAAHARQYTHPPSWHGHQTVAAAGDSPFGQSFSVSFDGTSTTETVTSSSPNRTSISLSFGDVTPAVPSSASSTESSAVSTSLSLSFGDQETCVDGVNCTRITDVYHSNNVRHPPSWRGYHQHDNAIIIAPAATTTSSSATTNLLSAQSDVTPVATSRSFTVPSRIPDYAPPDLSSSSPPTSNGSSVGSASVASGWATYVPACQWHYSCAQRDEEHMRQFSHPPGWPSSLPPVAPASSASSLPSSVSPAPRSGNDNSTHDGDTRPHCTGGVACLQTDLYHRHTVRHPPEWHGHIYGNTSGGVLSFGTAPGATPTPTPTPSAVTTTSSSASNSDGGRSQCANGASCTIAHPQHAADFQHPAGWNVLRNMKAAISLTALNLGTLGNRPMCANGMTCTNTQVTHSQQFQHPPGWAPSAAPAPSLFSSSSSSLPPCPDGVTCHRHLPNHAREFSHPPGWTDRVDDPLPYRPNRNMTSNNGSSTSVAFAASQFTTPSSSFGSTTTTDGFGSGFGGGSTSFGTSSSSAASSFGGGVVVRATTGGTVSSHSGFSWGNGPSTRALHSSGLIECTDGERCLLRSQYHRSRFYHPPGWAGHRPQQDDSDSSDSDSEASRAPSAFLPPPVANDAEFVALQQNHHHNHPWSVDYNPNHMQQVMNSNGNDMDVTMTPAPPMPSARFGSVPSSSNTAPSSGSYVSRPFTFGGGVDQPAVRRQRIIAPLSPPIVFTGTTSTILDSTSSSSATGAAVAIIIPRYGAGYRTVSQQYRLEAKQSYTIVFQLRPDPDLTSSIQPHDVEEYQRAQLTNHWCSTQLLYSHLLTTNSCHRPFNKGIATPDIRIVGEEYAERGAGYHRRVVTHFFPAHATCDDLLQLLRIQLFGECTAWLVNSQARSSTPMTTPPPHHPNIMWWYPDLHDVHIYAGSNPSTDQTTATSSDEKKVTNTTSWATFGTTPAPASAPASVSFNFGGTPSPAPSSSTSLSSFSSGTGNGATSFSASSSSSSGGFSWGGGGASSSSSTSSVSGLFGGFGASTTPSLSSSSNGFNFGGTGTTSSWGAGVFSSTVVPPPPEYATARDGSFLPRYSIVEQRSREYAAAFYQLQSDKAYTIIFQLRYGHDELLASEIPSTEMAEYQQLSTAHRWYAPERLYNQLQTTNTCGALTQINGVRIVGADKADDRGYHRRVILAGRLPPTNATMHDLLQLLRVQLYRECSDWLVVDQARRPDSELSVRLSPPPLDHPRIAWWYPNLYDLRVYVGSNPSALQTNRERHDEAKKQTDTALATLRGGAPAPASSSSASSSNGFSFGGTPSAMPSAVASSSSSSSSSDESSLPSSSSSANNTKGAKAVMKSKPATAPAQIFAFASSSKGASEEDVSGITGNRRANGEPFYKVTSSPPSSMFANNDPDGLQPIRAGRQHSITYQVRRDLLVVDGDNKRVDAIAKEHGVCTMNQLFMTHVNTCTGHAAEERLGWHHIIIDDPRREIHTLAQLLSRTRRQITLNAIASYGNTSSSSSSSSSIVTTRLPPPDVNAPWLDQYYPRLFNVVIYGGDGSDTNNIAQSASVPSSSTTVTSSNNTTSGFSWGTPSTSNNSSAPTTSSAFGFGISSSSSTSSNNGGPGFGFGFGVAPPAAASHPAAPSASRANTPAKPMLPIPATGSSRSNGEPLYQVACTPDELNDEIASRQLVTPFRMHSVRYQLIPSANLIANADVIEYADRKKLVTIHQLWDPLTSTSSGFENGGRYGCHHLIVNDTQGKHRTLADLLLNMRRTLTIDMINNYRQQRLAHEPSLPQPPNEDDEKELALYYPKLWNVSIHGGDGSDSNNKAPPGGGWLLFGGGAPAGGPPAIGAPPPSSSSSPSPAASPIPIPTPTATPVSVPVTASVPVTESGPPGGASVVTFRPMSFQGGDSGRGLVLVTNNTHDSTKASQPASSLEWGSPSQPPPSLPSLPSSSPWTSMTIATTYGDGLQVTDIQPWSGNTELRTFRVAKWGPNEDKMFTTDDITPQLLRAGIEYEVTYGIGLHPNEDERWTGPFLTTEMITANRQLWSGVMSAAPNQRLSCRVHVPPKLIHGGSLRLLLRNVVLRAHEDHVPKTEQFQRWLPNLVHIQFTPVQTASTPAVTAAATTATPSSSSASSWASALAAAASSLGYRSQSANVGGIVVTDIQPWAAHTELRSFSIAKWGPAEHQKYTSLGTITNLLPVGIQYKVSYRLAMQPSDDDRWIPRPPTWTQESITANHNAWLPIIQQVPHQRLSSNVRVMAPTISGMTSNNSTYGTIRDVLRQVGQLAFDAFIPPKDQPERWLPNLLEIQFTPVSATPSPPSIWDTPRTTFSWATPSSSPAAASTTATTPSSSTFSFSFSPKPSSPAVAPAAAVSASTATIGGVTVTDIASWHGMELKTFRVARWGPVEEAMFTADDGTTDMLRRGIDYEIKYRLGMEEHEDERWTTMSRDQVAANRRIWSTFANQNLQCSIRVKPPHPQTRGSIREMLRLVVKQCMDQYVPQQQQDQRWVPNLLDIRFTPQEAVQLASIATQATTPSPVGFAWASSSSSPPATSVWSFGGSGFGSSPSPPSSSPAVAPAAVSSASTATIGGLLVTDIASWHGTELKTFRVARWGPVEEKKVTADDGTTPLLRPGIDYEIKYRLGMEEHEDERWTTMSRDQVAANRRTWSAISKQNLQCSIRVKPPAMHLTQNNGGSIREMLRLVVQQCMDQYVPQRQRWQRWVPNLCDIRFTPQGNEAVQLASLATQATTPSAAAFFGSPAASSSASSTSAATSGFSFGGSGFGSSATASPSASSMTLAGDPVAWHTVDRYPERLTFTPPPSTHTSLPVNRTYTIVYRLVRDDLVTVDRALMARVSDTRDCCTVDDLYSNQLTNGYDHVWARRGQGHYYIVVTNTNSETVAAFLTTVRRAIMVQAIEDHTTRIKVKLASTLGDGASLLKRPPVAAESWCDHFLPVLHQVAIYGGVEPTFEAPPPNAKSVTTTPSPAATPSWAFPASQPSAPTTGTFNFSAANGWGSKSTSGQPSDDKKTPPWHKVRRFPLKGSITADSLTNLKLPTNRRALTVVYQLSQDDIVIDRGLTDRTSREHGCCSIVDLYEGQLLGRGMHIHPHRAGYCQQIVLDRLIANQPEATNVAGFLAIVRRLITLDAVNDQHIRAKAASKSYGWSFNKNPPPDVNAPWFEHFYPVLHNVEIYVGIDPHFEAPPANHYTHDPAPTISSSNNSSTSSSSSNKIDFSFGSASTASSLTLADLNAWASGSSHSNNAAAKTAAAAAAPTIVAPTAKAGSTPLPLPDEDSDNESTLPRNPFAAGAVRPVDNEESSVETDEEKKNLKPIKPAMMDNVITSVVHSPCDNKALLGRPFPALATPVPGVNQSIVDEVKISRFGRGPRGCINHRKPSHDPTSNALRVKNFPEFGDHPPVLISSWCVGAGRKRLPPTRRNDPHDDGGLDYHYRVEFELHVDGCAANSIHELLTEKDHEMARVCFQQQLYENPEGKGAVLVITPQHKPFAPPKRFTQIVRYQHMDDYARDWNITPSPSTELNSSYEYGVMRSLGSLLCVAQELWMMATFKRDLVRQAGGNPDRVIYPMMYNIVVTRIGVPAESAPSPSSSSAIKASTSVAPSGFGGWGGFGGANNSSSSGSAATTTSLFGGFASSSSSSSPSPSFGSWSGFGSSSNAASMTSSSSSSSSSFGGGSGFGSSSSAATTTSSTSSTSFGSAFGSSSSAFGSASSWALGQDGSVITNQQTRSSDDAILLGHGRLYGMSGNNTVVSIVSLSKFGRGPRGATNHPQPQHLRANPSLTPNFTELGARPPVLISSMCGDTKIDRTNEYQYRVEFELSVKECAANSCTPPVYDCKNLTEADHEAARMCYCEQLFDHPQHSTSVTSPDGMHTTTTMVSDSKGWTPITPPKRFTQIVRYTDMVEYANWWKIDPTPSTAGDSVFEYGVVRSLGSLLCVAQHLWVKANVGDLLSRVDNANHVIYPMMYNVVVTRIDTATMIYPSLSLAWSSAGTGFGFGGAPVPSKRAFAVSFDTNTAIAAPSSSSNGFSFSGSTGFAFGTNTVHGTGSGFSFGTTASGAVEDPQRRVIKVTRSSDGGITFATPTPVTATTATTFHHPSIYDGTNPGVACDGRYEPSMIAACTTIYDQLTASSSSTTGGGTDTFMRLSGCVIDRYHLADEKAGVNPKHSITPTQPIVYRLMAARQYCLKFLCHPTQDEVASGAPLTSCKHHTFYEETTADGNDTVGRLLHRVLHRHRSQFQRTTVGFAVEDYRTLYQIAIDLCPVGFTPPPTSS